MLYLANKTIAVTINIACAGDCAALVQAQTALLSMASQRVMRVAIQSLVQAMLMVMVWMI
jgi:hypothetical protein